MNIREFLQLYLNPSILFNFVFFILLLILLIFLKSFFSNFFVFIIRKLSKKFFNQTNEEFFDQLRDPIKILPFYLLTLFYPFNNHFLINLMNKLNISLLSIFIFYSLYKFFIPLLKKSKLINTINSAASYWTINFIKFLLIFLCVTSVLEVWGIKVGPIIAGLGLLGVAVALGAQDLFKNLISGIMILLENRFHIGDVISVPNHTEGTVEHIGFRSTLIRKFDSTPMTIPNHIFAEAPVLNFSNRTSRRINWIVGLEYSSTLIQIKSLTDYILIYLTKNENFLVNDNFKAFVRIDKFNDSSIDILVQCFTSTNDWDEFLKIKENLAIEIKKKVEELNLNFAFPSQTLYIERA